MGKAEFEILHLFCVSEVASKMAYLALQFQETLF